MLKGIARYIQFKCLTQEHKRTYRMNLFIRTVFHVVIVSSCLHVPVCQRGVSLITSVVLTMTLILSIFNNPNLFLLFQNSMSLAC